MPKTLHYLSLLLIILLIGCHDDRENTFEPWQLFKADTDHVLVFNNTVTGLQSLKQQQKVSGLFSLPQLPTSIDSLSTRMNSEEPSYLFITQRKSVGQTIESKTEYSWVFKINDVPSEKENDLLTFGRDTVFVFSESQYRIYSSNKTLNATSQRADQPTLNGLIKMIQFKKDKALVIAQKLNELHNIKLSDAPWVVFDPQTSPAGQTVHGILLTQTNDSRVEKSQNLVLDLGQKPGILKSPEIIPLGAQSSFSLALNSPQSLNHKIQSIDSTFVLSPFVETIDEASLIEFGNGKVLALKSLDMNMSLNTLALNWTEENNFRGVALKSLDPGQLQITALSKIFPEVPEMTYAFLWEEFIILTPNLGLAQDYIGQLQNKNTLARSNAWSTTEEDLARECSILVWHMDPKSKSFETMQLIQDNGFAHLNYARQTGNQKISSDSKGPLLRSIQLNAPLYGVPQFFSNHKSGGKNIVVQDENYRLYFIAPNGKTLWYRDLKEPILGEIKEVDLLRNGKKQLAFVTPSKWYVIDRNGRDVGPFPKNFSDPITQPLGIFDYDNNRKYRFVIVQDQSVYMYDAQGKRVKGFKYEKAPATVSHPPTHLRINGKDYILFLLKNGQLQILNRTGKVRVPVSEQFEFGPNLPIKHESKFVFWTQDGSQIQISPEGTVIKLTAKSPAQYRVVYYGAHTVEFDDPLLRIDQHLIELPLGNYLGPQVFKFGNKLRTVMVDQDSQNLYIYNSEGELLKDFPLFGASMIDMADINNNGQLELVVQGQENEVLIYSIN